MSVQVFHSPLAPEECERRIREAAAAGRPLGDRGAGWTLRCSSTRAGLRLAIRASIPGRDAFAPNCDLAFRASSGGTDVEMRSRLPVLTFVFFAFYLGGCLVGMAGIVQSARHPGPHDSGSPLAAGVLLSIMMLFAVVMFVAGRHLRAESDREIVASLVGEAILAEPTS